ncbi:nuclear transport factor 2 family protein [Micromonospora fulviviridis]|uniref:SnoaL-like domain-containing protein n=1 Tax=Micromonospora fulviviridis TaxID=47860 RepID=A0ABV2VV69_9ACTN
MDSDSRSKKEKTLAISKSIETGERYPWSYLDSRRYVQHNVNLRDGLGAILQFVDSLPPGTSKVTPVRAFEDGDFSFSHVQYFLAPYGDVAGFEVHRWENGRVVEHWDNLQPIPDQPNPSGRTMFDGPTDIVDAHLTQANKALAADFVRDVLIARDEHAVARYLDGDRYISHRPNFGDGAEELRRQIRGGGADELVHSKLERVLGEGNFCLVMSDGSLDSKHAAIFDLFRLENGKVAEHWDVVELLPPRSEWRNDNGKF